MGRGEQTDDLWERADQLATKLYASSPSLYEFRERSIDIWNMTAPDPEQFKPLPVAGLPATYYVLNLAGPMFKSPDKLSWIVTRAVIDSEAPERILVVDFMDKMVRRGLLRSPRKAGSLARVRKAVGSLQEAADELNSALEAQIDPAEYFDGSGQHDLEIDGLPAAPRCETRFRGLLDDPEHSVAAYTAEELEAQMDKFRAYRAYLS